MAIFHHLALKTIDLWSYVQEISQLSASEASQLIELGAVFINKRRVFQQDLICRPGDYLRLHSNPKRYQNLTPTKIFENEDFLVIDKPNGLPTHPTVDNYLENSLMLSRKLFGEELFLTHRLDQDTSGCLLFAKSKKSQSLFNQLLQSQQVTKYYHAEVDGHYSKLGRLEHWMEPSPRAPKKLSSFAVEGWQICHLDVVDRILKTDSSCLKIRLITGRTHQIRVQLSHIGHPVLGDAIYGIPNGDVTVLRLRSCEFHFPWNGIDLKIQADL